MDQFVSVLSLMSAFVLAILLFSSSFKNCDDTWKSFFSMVFFYIAYDVLPGKPFRQQNIVVLHYIYGSMLRHLGLIGVPLLSGMFFQG